MPQWNEGSYNRESYYLQPDQIVLLVDEEGNEGYVKIGRREPMGTLFVEYANPTNTLAANAETGFFDCEFLQFFARPHSRKI